MDFFTTLFSDGVVRLKRRQVFSIHIDGSTKFAATYGVNLSKDLTWSTVSGDVFICAEKAIDSFVFVFPTLQTSLALSQLILDSDGKFKKCIIEELSPECYTFIPLNVLIARLMLALTKFDNNQRQTLTNHIVFLQEKSFNDQVEATKMDATAFADLGLTYTEFEESQKPVYLACYNFMRRIIPNNMMEQEDRLELLLTNGIPKELCNRILQNKILWLISMHPLDISEVHISALTHLYKYDALDIYEMRALWHCLPSWSDDFDKYNWKHQFKELLDVYVKRELHDHLSEDLKRHPAYTKSKWEYGNLPQIEPLERMKNRNILTAPYLDPNSNINNSSTTNSNNGGVTAGASYNKYTEQQQGSMLLSETLKGWVDSEGEEEEDSDVVVHRIVSAADISSTAQRDNNNSNSSSIGNSNSSKVSNEIGNSKKKVSNSMAKLISVSEQLTTYYQLESSSSTRLDSSHSTRMTSQSSLGIAALTAASSDYIDSFYLKSNSKQLSMNNNNNNSGSSNTNSNHNTSGSSSSSYYYKPNTNNNNNYINRQAISSSGSSSSSSYYQPSNHSINSSQRHGYSVKNTGMQTMPYSIPFVVQNESQQTQDLYLIDISTSNATKVAYTNMNENGGNNSPTNMMIAMMSAAATGGGGADTSPHHYPNKKRRQQRADGTYSSSSNESRISDNMMISITSNERAIMNLNSQSNCNIEVTPIIKINKHQSIAETQTNSNKNNDQLQTPQKQSVSTSTSTNTETPIKTPQLSTKKKTLQHQTPPLVRRISSDSDMLLTSTTISPIKQMMKSPHPQKLQPLNLMKTGVTEQREIEEALKVKGSFHHVKRQITRAIDALNLIISTVSDEDFTRDLSPPNSSSTGVDHNKSNNSNINDNNGVGNNSNNKSAVKSDKKKKNINNLDEILNNIENIIQVNDTYLDTCVSERSNVFTFSSDVSDPNLSRIESELSVLNIGELETFKKPSGPVTTTTATSTIVTFGGVNDSLIAYADLSFDDNHNNNNNSEIIESNEQANTNHKHHKLHHAISEFMNPFGHDGDSPSPINSTRDDDVNNSNHNNNSTAASSNNSIVSSSAVKQKQVGFAIDNDNDAVNSNNSNNNSHSMLSNKPPLSPVLLSPSKLDKAHKSLSIKTDSDNNLFEYLRDIGMNSPSLNNSNSNINNDSFLGNMLMNNSSSTVADSPINPNNLSNDSVDPEQQQLRSASATSNNSNNNNTNVGVASLSKSNSNNSILLRKLSDNSLTSIDSSTKRSKLHESLFGSRRNVLAYKNNNSSSNNSGNNNNNSPSRSSSLSEKERCQLDEFSHTLDDQEFHDVSSSDDDDDHNNKEYEIDEHELDRHFGNHFTLQSGATQMIGDYNFNDYTNDDEDEDESLGDDTASEDSMDFTTTDNNKEDTSGKLSSNNSSSKKKIDATFDSIFIDHLCELIKLGNIEKFKEQLAHNHELTLSKKNIKYILFKFIKDYHNVTYPLRTLQYLIEELNANILSINRHGQSLLHLSYDNAILSEYLIRKGVNIMFKDKLGKSGLEYCLSLPYPYIIPILDDIHKQYNNGSDNSSNNNDVTSQYPYFMDEEYQTIMNNYKNNHDSKK